MKNDEHGSKMRSSIPFLALHFFCEEASWTLDVINFRDQKSVCCDRSGEMTAMRLQVESHVAGRTFRLKKMGCVLVGWWVCAVRQAETRNNFQQNPVETNTECDPIFLQRGKQWHDSALDIFPPGLFSETLEVLPRKCMKSSAILWCMPGR